MTVPPSPAASATQPPLGETMLVRKTLDLACSPATAFRVFTEGIGGWWPLDGHAIGPAVDCVIEGRIGGRIFERDADGNETLWGRVLAWEPPEHLRFSWHLRNAEELAQEVQVRFSPDGRGTRFSLEHRGFERRGEQAQALFESYRVGWDLVLARYLAAAAAA